MIEHNRALDWLTHTIMVSGVIFVCFPIYYAFVAATLPVAEVVKVPMTLIPGDQLLNNVRTAWEQANLGRQLFNSFVMAFVITVGKITISILSAYSITYFSYRFRMVAFWMVFITLMLPIEVRIVPTYQIAANTLLPLQVLVDLLNLEGLLASLFGHSIEISLEWTLLDSYAGLTLPLMASATATFLFRQFFLTVPEELCEAARIDGAGPIRFFRDILLPLSATNMAALGVILFVFSWNQYLWPLLMTTEPEMKTIVIGVAQLVPGIEGEPDWHIAMAAMLLALFPPVMVVLVLQGLFVKGLTNR